MRLKVSFEFEKLVLPIDYNHILQSTILNLISNDDFKSFIHDQGYIYEKRKFKLYTFSRIYGKFSIDKEKGKITFFDSANFIVSSYDDMFCRYLAERFLSFENIYLGGNFVSPKSIEVDYFESKNSLKTITKSPVTVYSTYLDENGKKKTLYYHPDDPKFKQIIEQNIYKKYYSIYKKEPKGFIKIKHVGKNPKRIVVYYKGFKIVGWMTAFDLFGDEELIKIAYEAGIGAKNSQGFGLLEKI
ncbi:hypothetical protein XJ44_00555 [Thermosipho affectus]|uniref:CRISPR-associated endoribonuclease n=1 Tax=Thermosipho affectus TaxID=660294 RepID=A0ABX3ILA8_9BACT|nr:CRISPR-associated endoribonuclease Cas6 [Thermosipho affectus]ONN28069.1 hypothetical protein XJ44_00555 [Thermosipho affectus]